jgi:hypothetical protein
MGTFPEGSSSKAYIITAITGVDFKKFTGKVITCRNKAYLYERMEVRTPTIKERAIPRIHR